MPGCGETRDCDGTRAGATKWTTVRMVVVPLRRSIYIYVGASSAYFAAGKRREAAKPNRFEKGLDVCMWTTLVCLHSTICRTRQGTSCLCHDSACFWLEFSRPARIFPAKHARIFLNQEKETTVHSTQYTASFERT